LGGEAAFSLEWHDQEIFFPMFWVQDTGEVIFSNCDAERDIRVVLGA
jgi:hypothetical protein